MVHRWASVVDSVSTLNQHWYDVSRLLGSGPVTMLYSCNRQITKLLRFSIHHENMVYVLTTQSITSMAVLLSSYNAVVGRVISFIPQDSVG